MQIFRTRHHHYHYPHHHHHRSTKQQLTSPIGMVLGSAQDVILAFWGRSIPGLGWKTTYAVYLASSPVGGLKQRVDVSGFILLHAQNVAKQGHPTRI